MKKTALLLLATAIHFSLFAQYWAPFGDHIYNTNSGNVGIGYGGANPLEKLHVQGNMFLFGSLRLGQQKDDVGYGRKLVFDDNGNGDALWISRYNAATNASELHLNAGNDGNQSDKFVVGYTDWQGTWFPKFNFLSDGRLGIGINPVEKLTVNGNLYLADFTTGVGNAGANTFLKMNDRFTLQATTNVNNDWTRGVIGQNIAWNNTTNKWDISGPYSDFSVIKMESNGNMGFYTNVSTNSAYSATETDLKQYLRMWITGDGRVSIGNLNPNSYKLAVDGKIGARGVKVTLDPQWWPDYVLDSSYKLMNLDKLQIYIDKNKHLPNIPSAEEVRKNEGVELGEMNVKLLEKIEELTLYVIDLKKEIEAIKKENAQIKEEIKSKSPQSRK